MTTITRESIRTNVRRYSINYTVDNVNVTLEALTFDDVTDTLAQWGPRADGPILVIDSRTGQRINLWASEHVASVWQWNVGY